LLDDGSYGCNDVWIRTAAAEVAAETFANFLAGQIGELGFANFGRDKAGMTGPGFVEHGDRGADLAGRAVAALKTVVLDESRLDGVKISVAFQAFNRSEPVPFMHNGEGEAGVDAAAIDKYGAGSALAVVAAFFGACEAEVLPEKIEEGHARVEKHCVIGAIDIERRADKAGGRFPGLGVSGDEGGNTSGENYQKLTARDVHGDVLWF
jgi:hypothetical protein